MTKLISYIDFKTNKITRNEEDYLIKHIILKVYAPTNRASKHIKQIVIELIEEIDKSICRDGQFNILFSPN